MSDTVVLKTGPAPAAAAKAGLTQTTLDALSHIEGTIRMRVIS